MALPAVTHLTPVVGIDVHMVNLPPAVPTPIPHPHVGFVLDLREYVSAAAAVIGSIVFSFVEEEAEEFLSTHQDQIAAVMDSDIVKGGMHAMSDVMNNPAVQAGLAAKKKIDGALAQASEALGANVGNGGGGRPILVNGLMRATAGTHTNHVPGLHFPLGIAFTGPDAKGPSQDAESFMGSRTVLANNDPMSFMALPALSCWFAGMEPMGHNGAHTDRSYLSLPTSTMLPIPAGRPVLVGGPPVMNMLAVAAALFKAFRGSALAKKLFKYFPSGFVKCQIFDAEPVNSITGEVVVQQHDFTIEGRLPLVWDRYYASHDGVAGALGHGWRSPADIRLELIRDGDRFGAAARFHDHATGFEELPLHDGWQHRVHDWQHGHALYANDGSLILRTRAGLEYVFPLSPDWRDQVPPADDGYVLPVPLAMLADLNGNAWQIRRREDGSVQRLVEWAGDGVTGRELHCGPGNVSGCLGTMALLDPHGEQSALARYQQDPEGDLVAVYDALGTPYEFEYGRSHLMVRHTDRNGLSFYYSHYQDAVGVWRVNHAWGDGGLYDYHFVYDPEHLETRFTDSLGHTTILQYNDQQWPVVRVNGLGGVSSYLYDGQGRTIAEVDPSGHTTTWRYDAYGNLLEHTLPDRSAVRTQYDEWHRPVRITDPEGGNWQQVWDARGNLLRQVTPSGLSTGFDYDVRGQLRCVTDAAQQRTTLAYDGLGLLASLTDALGRATRFEHDVRGNLMQTVAADGDITTYGYDAKDRLVRCRLPDGRRLGCGYDGEDNLIRYTDEAARDTTFSYFGQGQLASRTDPDGSVTRYHYDTEEQLTGVTNPLGETWHLQRDAAGRLVGEVDYDGQARSYAYNPAGHLLRSIDPLGNVLAFSCDALGRVTERRVFREDGERSHGEHEHYRYNRRGQLTEAGNGGSMIARSYDADGRLVGETQQQAQVEGSLTYAYDAAGRLQSQFRQFRHTVTAGLCSSQTLSYEYDPLGQVRTLQIDAHEPVHFSRDAVGRLTRVQFAPGLSHRHEYDRGGRLSRLATIGGAGREEHTDYAYDVQGNLTARHDSRMGVDHYRYDPLGRIREHIDPAGRVKTLMHDAHGDRFTTLHADDTGRTLRQSGGAVWQLDAAGQLAERRDHAGMQRFEWNALGRLCGLTDERGGRHEYSYDALGRRMGKRAIDGRGDAACGAQTWFLWDGDVMIGELAQPAEADASPRSGRQDRFYVYYPDSFEPLAVQVYERTSEVGSDALIESRASGSEPAAAAKKLYYYQNDPNGMPLRLRGGDGGVVWEAHYTVGGGVDHVETGLVYQPLRLSGQYFDSESGLHYNRHRYYDPSTGSFISQDPIGLDGGINPYQFAPNVFGWIDPLGLANKAFRNQMRQIMEKAGKKEGNTGCSFAVDRRTADNLGKAFVGEGHTVGRGRNGEIWFTSSNGLRLYRSPSDKASEFARTGKQANFHKWSW